MIVTFSYPLPDELYVEGVSGKIVGNYTYNGPDEISVLIDNVGAIVCIEPTESPEISKEQIKKINAKENTAFAYILHDYFIDEYVYPYEYEEIEMENGDIYKKMKNPNLTDAYELIYNLRENKFELVQILKDKTNLGKITAKQRKEYIEKYSNKYAFPDSIETKISEYIQELDLIMNTAPDVHTWKYINIPQTDVPKIPFEIAVEFSKLPNEGE